MADTNTSIPKKYARQKLVLSITSSVISFGLLVVAVATPVSRNIEGVARSVFENNYLAFLLFVVILGGLINIITLPLSYASGFILEHKYDLSNQTIGGWIGEKLKGLAIAVVVGLPILALFYWLLSTYQSMWWLPVGIAMFLLSIVFSRLAPTIIFPLFYKFVPIENEEIKQRITKICEAGGMNVQGIFRFNMSKNTKKANAAFTGIGKSKRIIIGDTLLDKFTPEEIDAVFAHEVGHFAKKHIWRLMAVNTALTFAGLYFTSVMYAYSLAWFGFNGAVNEIAALPMLAAWLSIYSLVTSPLNNTLSRKYEYEADAYAMQTIKNKEIFASMMHKLAETNLADTAPHPLVEFWFHDHPSIEKRIKAAQSL
jgi:STE24 endopeptidase